MPRRVADYAEIDGFTGMNQIATAGAAVLVLSFVPFGLAIVRSLRSPATCGADPWEANSLEWATSSPPPHHNFDWLPPIRSERPVFDLRWINYPDVAAPGERAAWDARQAHDPHWVPIPAGDSGEREENGA